ncbi:hypothetical protein KGF54_005618 [Candida jiufengensis]|uniref:uncharacterized protein n=1 Tax=Candida jiufengensis TaxID=497108 RepID=UPI0022257EC8|nr:uncharacterized protein KGF54_005618 [Candida jiufengensis]KAI5949383.1 hypothetical protein KGF54_005618 [Candida jiufengensis]
MHLIDLPIELTQKMIPKDQTLLNLPITESIKWLNLFHPYESLTILKAGYMSRDWKLYMEKFQRKIYLNFGEAIDQIHYSNFIIIDYSLIANRILEFSNLFRFLQIWTGITEEHTFIWLSELSLKPNNSKNLYDVEMSVTDNKVLTTNFTKFKIKYENILKEIRHKTESIPHHYPIQKDPCHFGSFFNNLLDIEINLDYDEYLKSVDLINQYTSNRDSITPTTAKIIINPTKSSPKFFKPKIVTDLFKPRQNLTIEYFGQETTVQYLDEFTYCIPQSPGRISLAFGKLDYVKVFDLFKNSAVERDLRLAFQVKISRSYYNSIQKNVSKKFWKREFYKDCVILCLFRYFQIWTGDPERYTFVWLSQIPLKPFNSSNLYDVEFLNFDDSVISLPFTIFRNRYMSILNGTLNKIEPSPIGYFNKNVQNFESFFKNLNNIELNLDYDKYLKVVMTIKAFDTKFEMVPQSAKLIINPTKTSPVYFKPELVYKVFKPAKSLTLHYFGQFTTVQYVDELTNFNYLNLDSLNLGFGELEYYKVFKEIEKRRRLDFQVKLSRTYYNSIQGTDKKRHWKREINQDFVVIWFEPPSFCRA